MLCKLSCFIPLSVNQTLTLWVSEISICMFAWGGGLLGHEQHAPERAGDPAKLREMGGAPRESGS